jgi:hypothetical protein
VEASIVVFDTYIWKSKYLVILTDIFPSYIKLQEGRVGLLQVIKMFLDEGIITGICIFGSYILKYAVVILICKTPKLSDEKVKAITKMISKSSKFNS